LAKPVSVLGISISGADAGNYNLLNTTASTTADITKALLTINAVHDSRQYNGTTSSTGTPSVSGTLYGTDSVSPLSQAFLSKNVLGTNGSTLTPIFTVNDGNGGNNYAVTVHTATGTITAAPLTINAVTDSRPYNGTTSSTGTPSVIGTIYGTDTISPLSQSFSSKHVLGVNASTLVPSFTINDGDGGADYNVTVHNASGTITAANLTPALTNSPITKAYNGTNAAPLGFIPAYSFTGLVSGDTGATLTNTGATYNSAHVASATTLTVTGLVLTGITGIDGSLVSDYHLSPTSVSHAASITAATLTPTLTNSPITKVYNGTNAAPAGFSPTYNITGFITGDTAATLSNTGATYNSAHVATANLLTVTGLAITGITGSHGSVASDYTLSPTSVSAPATITAKTLTPSLTNSPITKVYDGTNSAPAGFVPNYNITGLVTGDTAATLSSTGATFNSSHVASANTLTVTGLAITGISGSNGSVASDYNLTPTSVSRSATITAANLTPTLTNSPITKVYNGTNAAPLGFIPTYSFAGLVSGDTSATLNNTGATYNSAHVASATTLTVNGLSLAGITGSNGSLTSDYHLTPTSVSAAASITAKTLTPALTNSPITKVYNGTNAAPAGFVPTYNFTGLVAGDSSATLSNTGATYNSAHVATANLLTVTGLAITGISGSNGSIASDYSLNPTIVSAAASITAKALTPSLTNSPITKVYDGTNSAPAGFIPNYNITGLVTGDTAATLSNTGITYNSVHVATANLLTVSGLAITGISGSNGSLASDYSLNPTSVSRSATITAATLTPTLSNSPITKVYNDTLGAPAGFTPAYSFTGLVPGDTTATLSNTGSSYNSDNVATATTLTVTGLALTGITGSHGSLITDYHLSPTSVSAAASITPASLSITATGPSKTYGQALTAGQSTTNFTTTSMPGGESISSVFLTPDAAGLNASTPAGSPYTVTPSAPVAGAGGFIASNYNITYNAFHGTVAKANLTISADDVIKVFNVLANITGFYSVSGLVNGDTVSSVALSSAGTAQSAPKSGSPYTITASGALGTGLSNYNITYVPGQLFVVPSLTSSTISADLSFLESIELNESMDVPVGLISSSGTTFIPQL
jgi:hypothetical protein